MRIAALVLAAWLAGSAPARAGEVIGNTYISEKDGTFEVSTEAWTIQDREQPGSAHLVDLVPKQPISGTTPKVSIFRLNHMGGQIQADAMMQQLREAFTKQGLEVGAVETRRIQGKRVLALQVSLTKDGGKSNGVLYMMQGEKSLYWAQFFANVTVWEPARALLDELMERIKY